MNNWIKAISVVSFVCAAVAATLGSVLYLAVQSPWVLLTVAFGVFFYMLVSIAKYQLDENEGAER